VGLVIPKKSDDIGLAVYALFSVAVMLVLASFLVMGILHFVAGGWRHAPVSDWVLLFPIVLYLAWKLLSPVTKYAQRHGWIPQTLTRRMNAALNSGGQSPLGKVVVNASLVFLVAAGLFQSFDLAVVFFSLVWAGLLIDLVWHFVTARKPH
jgi:hypothetical protein